MKFVSINKDKSTSTYRNIYFDPCFLNHLIHIKCIDMYVSNLIKYLFLSANNNIEDVQS